MFDWALIDLLLLVYMIFSAAFVSLFLLSIASGDGKGKS